MTRIQSNTPGLLSYHFIRRAVGILGISLPVVLLFGLLLLTDCHEIEGSISKYYHTIMRNFLVGVLCAVALFLFSYRGYKLKIEKRKSTEDKTKRKKPPINDNWAGNFAGIFALGVAFFPTTIRCDDLTQCITEVYLRSFIGYVHLASALFFFLALAYISYILFPRGRKKQKNRLYKRCGVTIVICTFTLLIYVPLLKKHLPGVEKFSPVFFLETIALIAFGISWLVKGRMEVFVKMAARKIRHL